MLNDIPVKPSISPFHPLPAIGQKLEQETNSKVIVFDLDRERTFTPRTISRRKLQHSLEPLTPLRLQGYVMKSSLDVERKPQFLLRENTYDVIEPVYLQAVKVKKKDTSLTRKIQSLDSENNENIVAKVSPKTRFRNAAITIAKMSSMPETGKLLNLRERETFNLRVCREDNERKCSLQNLPTSPAQNLNKLSEIFQRLEMKGRHKDKMRRDNSWF